MPWLMFAAAAGSMDYVSTNEYTVQTKVDTFLNHNCLADVVGQQTL